MNTQQAFCDPAVHISDCGLNSQKDQLGHMSVVTGELNYTSAD